MKVLGMLNPESPVPRLMFPLNLAVYIQYGCDRSVANSMNGELYMIAIRVHR
jgi:hypothetical protein